MDNSNCQDYSEILQKQSENTLNSHLGIKFIEATKEGITATMPVSDLHKQRFGILHGGATAALAETVASLAGWIHINPDTQSIVGVELNINHLRKTLSGEVRAVARPHKIGRKLHVWEVKVFNDQDKLAAISRCTLAVVERL